MAKKRTRVGSGSSMKSRRDALRDLGALVSLPALASLGCGVEKEEPEETDDDDSRTQEEDSASEDRDTGSSNGRTDSGSASGGRGDSGARGGQGDDGGRNGSSDSGRNGSSDAGASTESDAAADDASEPATSGDAGATGGDGFFPPNFEDAGSCSLTATDPAGEGPFFIHETEVMSDPVMLRADLRDGHEGVELQLHLRVLDASDGCMTPISDVEVYVWHTDALGFYSGFNGQNPNQTYMGGFERTPENDERFCRGTQVTNAEGVVSFRTLYPGWYNGRPIHIHFVALKKGSGPGTMSYRSADYHVFTTQMYFDEQFSRDIHENNAPYMTRASGMGYETYIKPGSSTVRASTRMEGNVAVASLNIITRANESRGGGGGGFGGLFGG